MPGQWATCQQADTLVSSYIRGVQHSIIPVYNNVSTVSTMSQANHQSEMLPVGCLCFVIRTSKPGRRHAH